MGCSFPRLPTQRHQILKSQSSSREGHHALIMPGGQRKKHGQKKKGNHDELQHIAQQSSHGIKHPSQARNERRHEDTEGSGEHKCPLNKTPAFREWRGGGN